MTLAPEVGPAGAVAMARQGAIVVDVREADEWDDGHVRGAVHVPLGEVATRVPSLIPGTATPILLYCAVGERSAVAARLLRGLGYGAATSMRGTPDGWRAAGGAWEVPDPSFDPAWRERYARQLRLPEVGEEGQRRLGEAKILLVGAGGLGSPAALYLAAAGVGTLGIVDDDDVEISNLQRQVLHGTDDLGMPKVESARRRLADLNADTTVVAHAERLEATNADRLLDGYDIIVDGSDSFETRYALNDAAVRRRIPVVHGSVYKWDGQVTTLVPFEGPCYRCLHPSPAPEALAPACSVIGVLGVLPGIVGMLQATEVLKLVLGIGRPLVGRILVVDALTMRFDELRVARDPRCSSCGVPASQSAEGVVPALGR